MMHLLTQILFEVFPSMGNILFDNLYEDGVRFNLISSHSEHKTSKQRCYDVVLTFLRRVPAGMYRFTNL